MIEAKYNFNMLGPPPAGRVILISADQVYIDKFFSGFYDSYLKNASSWGLLVNIVGASQEFSYSFKKDLGNASVFVSEMKCVSNIIVKKSRVVSENRAAVVNMLARHSAQSCFIKKVLYKMFYLSGFRVDFFISKKRLRADARKVFYACSRFMLPVSVFRHVDEMVILDIDSKINEGFDRYKITDSRVACVGRDDSWSTFMAGMIWLHGRDTIVRYFNLVSIELRRSFCSGFVFWGLDQVVLDEIARIIDIQRIDDMMNFDNSEPSKALVTSFKGTKKWMLDCDK